MSRPPPSIQVFNSSSDWGGGWGGKHPSISETLTPVEQLTVVNIASSSKRKPHYSVDIMGKDMTSVLT